MGAARDCLVELEHLSGEPFGAGRSEILRRVTDLFLITCERQSEADRAVFATVMQRLADKSDMAARAELARRLAETPFAPHPLVLKLAKDDIEVARPLLERSGCLSEDDLIEIARTAAPTHIDAISRRAKLGSRVTDVLVQNADETMLTRLILNPDADLSEAANAVIVGRAATYPELRLALIERRGVSATKPDQEVPPEQAKHVDLIAWTVDSAREEVAAPMATVQARGAAPADEARLAELARAGKLDETIETLGALTGLARPLVETCLLSAEAPALVVLCKAHRFAGTTFQALLELRLSVGAISTKGVASAMRRYETMNLGMAQRIMRFLQVRLANTADGGTAA